MSIEIEICCMTDAGGRVCAVNASTRASFSPKEGFDHDVIAKMEHEIDDLVNFRLAEALEKGKAMAK